MSNEPLIYVVRHGQTEWSVNGRHTGRTDIPLTTTGEEQARAAGAVLAGVEFTEVWTSPLSRARHTCALAGLGDAAEVTHRAGTPVRNAGPSGPAGSPFGTVLLQRRRRAARS